MAILSFFCNLEAKQLLLNISFQAWSGEDRSDSRLDQFQLAKRVSQAHHPSGVLHLYHLRARSGRG